MPRYSVEFNLPDEDNKQPSWDAIVSVICQNGGNHVEVQEVEEGPEWEPEQRGIGVERVGAIWPAKRVRPDGPETNEGGLTGQEPY